MLTACVSRMPSIVVLLGGMIALPTLAQMVPPGGVPELAEQCQSCHGASGRPANDEWPVIGGQNRAYLMMALQALRSGQRGGGNAETMQPFAKDLTDAQIEELATFFSSLRNLR